MKKLILLLLPCFLIFNAMKTEAQKVISGRSQSQMVTLKPEYIRGLPPNLYVNLSFEDDNKNGILEANEKAESVDFSVVAAILPGLGEHAGGKHRN